MNNDLFIPIAVVVSLDHHRLLLRVDLLLSLLLLLMCRSGLWNGGKGLEAVRVAASSSAVSVVVGLWSSLDGSGSRTIEDEDEQ